MSDSSILSQYRSLFAEAYKENIDIDNETITEEDSKVLQELDPDEVLDNLKDLIKNLIEFKRFVRKAEVLESLEAESRSISTPVSEDTQSFYYSFKIVNEANEELKKEILALKGKIFSLEARLKDAGTEEKSREQKPSTSETKEDLISKQGIQEDEKNNIKDFIHSRISSENALASKSARKSNIIKSVKFEYVTVNNRKVSINVKPLKKKKNVASIASSPEKLKTVHARSNSNVFVNPKLLR